MYKTIDSISSQLAILHVPRVIYMPSWNGPAILQRPVTYRHGLEHIYIYPESYTCCTSVSASKAYIVQDR